MSVKRDRPKPRLCKVCGCTEEDACSVYGVPCVWVAAQRCSACSPIELLLISPPGRTWLRMVLEESEQAEVGARGYEPPRALWRSGRQRHAAQQRRWGG